MSRDATLVAELAAKGGVTLFQKIGPIEGWKRPLPARSGYEHGLNKVQGLGGQRKCSMSAAYDSMVWCCTTAVSCSQVGSNAPKTQLKHSLHLRAHWRTTLPGMPMPSPSRSSSSSSNSDKQRQSDCAPGVCVISVWRPLPTAHCSSVRGHDGRWKQWLSLGPADGSQVLGALSEWTSRGPRLMRQAGSSLYGELDSRLNCLLALAGSHWLLLAPTGRLAGVCPSIRRCALADLHRLSTLASLVRPRHDGLQSGRRSVQLAATARIGPQKQSSSRST